MKTHYKLLFSYLFPIVLTTIIGAYLIMPSRDTIIHKPSKENTIINNSTATATTTVMSECEALMAFYNATGGDNWINIENGTVWDGDCANLCNWHGITCNGNGEVVEIKLGGKNLVGSIPSEIQFLTKLEVLKVDHNAINSVSSSISNLSNLVFLDLYNNNLSGNIPNFYGNITSLEVLYLNLNNFTGSIPSNLGNLVNIETLGLHANNLTGTLPSSFSNFSNLEYMNLGSNNLEGCFPPSYVSLCGKAINVTNNPNFWQGGNFNDFCNNPNACCENINNAGTITYNGSTTSTSGSFNPSTISGSNVSGSNVQYQWESSTNNGATWQNINGATASTYNPPSFTTTTCFRRKAKTACASDWLFSNQICFSVSCEGFTGPGYIQYNGDPYGGTVASTSNSTMPAPIYLENSTNPTTGDEVWYDGNDIEYLWQYSTNGGASWTNAPLTNPYGGYGHSHTISEDLTQTTCFRRGAKRDCSPANAFLYTVAFCFEVNSGGSSGGGGGSGGGGSNSGQPDLIVINQNASPNSTTAGSTINISCSVKNQGNASASSSQLRYYWSSNSSFSTNNSTQIWASSLDALNANNTSPQSASYTIPSGTNSGTYYIHLYADATSQVSENNESNNVSTIAVTVTGSGGSGGGGGSNSNQPDLVVINQTASSSSTTAGSTINLSCSVKNQGNTSAASSQLRYYWSSYSAFNSNNSTQIAIDNVNSLNANSTSFESASYTIPSGTSSGTYYIHFYADATSQVNESIESNNVSTITVTVTGSGGSGGGGGGSSSLPDLIFLQVNNNPTILMAGETVIVDVDVKNIGGSTAASNSMQAFWSATTTTTPPFPIGSVGVPTLSSNATTTITQGIPASDTMEPGTYYLHLKLDGDNDVNESNENNNATYMEIIIQGDCMDYTNGGNITTTANQSTYNNSINVGTLSNQSNPSGGDGGNPIYRWQKKINNESYQTISNTNTSSYAVGTIHKTEGTTICYRRQVHIDCETSATWKTSNEICFNFLNCNAPTSGGTIAAIGASTTYGSIINVDINNTVAASDNSGQGGAIQYKWYQKIDNGAWGLVSGATADYNATISSDLGTTICYQRRAYKYCNTTLSTTYALSNNVCYTFQSCGAPTNAGTITASGSSSSYNNTMTVNISNTASATGGQGQGNISYQWYRKIDNSTWGQVTGNGATYNATIYKSWGTTICYKRRAYKNCSGTISDNYTETTTICYTFQTCDPLTYAGSIVSTTPATSYNTSMAVSLNEQYTVFGGSGGTVKYQWYRKIDNQNWQSITGATSTNYNATIYKNSGTSFCYKRRAYRQCDDVITTYKETNIKCYEFLECQGLNNAGNIAATSDEVSYANSYNPTIIQSTVNPSGGEGGAIQYTWQRKQDSGNWSAINNATAATYNPPYLYKSQATTFCYRRLANRVCNGNEIGNTVISNEVCYQFEECLSATDGGTIAATSEQSTYADEIDPSIINQVSPASGGSVETHSVLYYWLVQVNGGDLTYVEATTPYYDPPILSKVQGQNTTYCYTRSALTYCDGGYGSEYANSNTICYELKNCEALESAGTIAATSDTTTYESTLSPSLIVEDVAPSGGEGGTFRYKWYRQVNGGFTVPLSNTDSPNYQPPTLSGGSNNTNKYCYHRSTTRMCNGQAVGTLLFSNQICYEFQDCELGYTEENYNAQICEGETYTFGTSTYTESGIYRDTIFDAHCDTINILDLAVFPIYNDTTYAEICEGGIAYEFEGQAYDIAGIYTINHNTIEGCDSTLVLNLTYQDYIQGDTTYASICQGENYTFYNENYNATGTYTYNDPINCSIETLILEVLPIYEDVLAVDICEGDIYNYNNNTYMEAGIYAHMFSSIDGCDSLVNLQISLIEIHTDTTYIAICEGESYDFYNENYSTTGYYDHTIESVDACDTLKVLNLKVINTTRDTTIATICQGEVYTFENMDYYEAGLYSDTLLSASNCDSIRTLNLIVNPIYSDTTYAEICEQYTYYFEGQNYSTEGIYTKSYSSEYNCDSLKVLSLTLNAPTPVDTVYATVCEGGRHVFAGGLYTQTGIYTYNNYNECIIETLNLTVEDDLHTIVDTTLYQGQSILVGDTYYDMSGAYEIMLESQHGCDSLLSLNLNIIDSYNDTTNVVICEGENYTFYDETYTTTGTYTHTIEGNTIDSIFVLNLAVATISRDTTHANICEGEAYLFENTNYYETGIYHDTLQSTANCDSILSLKLTVHPGYSDTTYVEICEGSAGYEFEGQMYEEAGIYTVTYPTAAACDSTLVLNLTYEEYGPGDTVYRTICAGESYSFFNQDYDTAGTYTHNVVEHCIIAVLELEVLPVYDEILAVNICAGESYDYNNTTYTETGIYEHMYTSSGGCDSLVNLQLSVLEIYSDTTHATICAGESYAFYNENHSTAGLYDHTITSADACDSLFVLNLEVETISRDTTYASICEGEAYLFENTNYYETGIYHDTLQSTANCDSILSLNLLVHSTYSDTTYAEICEGSAGYEFEGQMYEEAGIYTVTYPTAAACDSTLVLNLTYEEYGPGDTIYRTICAGESYSFFNQDYDTAGTYTHNVVEHCIIAVLELAVLPVYDEILAVNICAGESYDYNNTTYTETGIYEHMYTSSGGCDSLVNLQLSVLEIYSDTTHATICAGENYAFYNENYSTAGLYDHTITSADACDSLFVLNLEVETISRDTTYASICEGEAYLFENTNYYETGIYHDTLQSTANCDSMLTLNLLVHSTYSDTTYAEICEGSAGYEFEGQMYEEAGIYTVTYPTAAACDSTLVLNLTYEEYGSGDTVYRTICAGESYSFYDQDYDTAGTYTHNVVEHCIIAVLELEVLPVYDEILAVNICAGESYDYNNTTYAETGIYEHMYTSSGGCDSLVNLHLSVLETYSDTTYATICAGENYAFYNENYDATGIYHYTTTSGATCDSLFVLNLEVNTVSRDTTYAAICEGDDYLFRSMLYEEAGIYTDTLISDSDCDSLLTLSLSVHPSYSDTTYAQICEGGVGYEFEGQNFEIAGVYRITYPSAYACDSSLVLNLSYQGYAEGDTLYASICAGESYTFYNEIYSQTGIYTHENPITCESETLNLEVLNPVEETLIATICAGETYYFNNNNYNEAGTYEHMLTSEAGCDSLVNLQLTVLDIYSDTTYAMICAGEIYTFYNQTYNQAGTYTYTQESADACDSIFVLDLSLTPVATATTSITICEGTTYTFGGIEYSEAGMYHDTIPTAICDSIATLDLSIQSSITDTTYAELCDGSGFYYFQGQFYTTPGIYTKTYTAAGGCDSILVLNLGTKPYEQSDTIYATICEGERYRFYRNSYTETGVYTYNNSFNCRIETVDLTVLPPTIDTINVSICEGDFHIVGDIAYTQSGTYNGFYQSQYGCDSIVTVNLSVIENYIDTTYASICAGESYTFYNENYSTTGIYNHSVASDEVCDSLFVLNLEVNTIADDTIYAEICDDESYYFAGMNRSLTGIYSDTLTSSNNCDSIITLDLTVHPSYHDISDAELCNGKGIVYFHGQFLNNEGTYVKNFTTENGCDSTFVLNITHVDLEVSSDTTHVTICEGESYRIHRTEHTEAGFYTYDDYSTCTIKTLHLSIAPDHTMAMSRTICAGDSIVVGEAAYTSAGTYVNFLTSEYGCDSTVWLYLYVVEPTSDETYASICEGESYDFNNESYDTAGSYTHNLTNQMGCDSTHTLHLEINLIGRDTFYASICAGESIDFGNATYYEQGIYYDTIPSNECDSIVMLDLTVFEPDRDTTYASICEGSSFSFEGETHDIAGIYEYTYTNSNNCDSIKILDLTIDPIYTDTTYVNVCAGESYSFEGETHDIAGIYEYTYTTSNNCDSIKVLELVINPVNSDTTYASICAGSSFDFEGETHDIAGIYEYTYTTSHNCDSIKILDLTIDPIYTDTTYANICEGETYSFEGETHDIAGIYEYTYTTSHNCDSIKVLELSINPVDRDTTYASICEGSSFDFEGENYESAGIYEHTYTNSNNCDSIKVLDLTIEMAISTTTNIEICQGTSYEFGGMLYDQSGLYADTLSASAGCDSISFLDLTVMEAPSIDSLIIEHPSTCAGANGAIAIMASGDMEMTYSIDNGETWQTDHTFSGLASGSYDIMISDVDGICEVHLDSLATLQGDENFSMELVEMLSPLCVGEASGMIEVAAIGGTPPYLYYWSEEVDINNSRDDLVAGTYQIAVVDAVGCESQLIVELEAATPFEVQLQDFEQDLPYCTGQELTLLTEGDSAMAYYWEDTNGFYGDADSIIVSESGMYWMTAYNTDDCETRDSIEVLFSDTEADANFLLSSEGILDLPIVAVDISWPIPDSIVWEYDDTLVEMEANPQNHGIFTFTSTGVYTIKMYAYMGDCIAEVEKEITIYEDSGQLSNENYGNGGAQIFEFTLFPNPNNGSFTVRLAASTDQEMVALSVYRGSDGYLEDYRELSGAYLYEEDYNLALSAGVYTMLFQMGSQWQTFSFIVQ